MVKSWNFQKTDYALITGASSGIGEAYANRFASLGCSLVLVARNITKLNDVASDIKKSYGVQVEVIDADLSDDSDVKRVEESINQNENIVALINCAGFALRKHFIEQDLNKQLSMIQLHILTSTHLTHAAIPKMIKNNRGIIINVSSLLSLMTLNNNVVHCATKAYLNRFSQNLAMELCDKNIKVQALNPGYTITNFHSTEEFKGVKKNYPKLFTMTTDELVDKSIDALKKRRVIVVPGIANQMLVRLKFLFAPIVMKSMG